MGCFCVAAAGQADSGTAADEDWKRWLWASEDVFLFTLFSLFLPALKTAANAFMLLKLVEDLWLMLN